VVVEVVDQVVLPPVSWEEVEEATQALMDPHIPLDVEVEVVLNLLVELVVHAEVLLALLDHNILEVTQHQIHMVEVEVEATMVEAEVDTSNQMTWVAVEVDLDILVALEA